MFLERVNFKRPVLSYSKVQIAISKLIRGRKSFIDKKSINGKVLLNVGCGPYPNPGFINLEYSWHPGIDICWNIVTKPYPLADNSLEGVYSEHCLEHIPYESCFNNLKEFHRMLKPEGTLRIIVPDGETYCSLYLKKLSDPGTMMPYGEQEETGMISVNRIFRSHGHQFIYDFTTFKLLLEKAGFTRISKQEFGKGRDARLLIDRPKRAVESLYVEAIK